MESGFLAIWRAIDAMLAGDECAHLLVHLAEEEKRRVPESGKYLNHLLEAVFTAVKASV